MNKRIIYQVLPRLFHAPEQPPAKNGHLEQNGCGKFDLLSDRFLKSWKDMGITDIWLTGIIRHASGTAYPGQDLEASHPDLLKGKAGSPYAIKDYYDVDPDLANEPGQRFEEFKQLVSRISNNGLGTLIDFVPNHVSRDYRSLMKPASTKDLGENDQTDVAFDPDNQFYYLPGQELVLPRRESRQKKSASFTEVPAKVTGNDIYHAHPGLNDWYETIKLNYGVDWQTGQKHVYPQPDTWHKMLDILLFWADTGISGFRCDMAGMVPVEFWTFAIASVKTRYPKMLFIAEIYEPAQYQAFLDAGFDYLYDKEGFYNQVRNIMTGVASTQVLTDLWKSLNGLDNRMLRFIENHDEQRVASYHFAGSARKGLPATAAAALMNGGPVLIYFGQELGEPAEGDSGFSGHDGRTSIFDYTTVPTVAAWIRHISSSHPGMETDDPLRQAYAKLLLFASRNPVFTSGQFYDLMWFNEGLPQETRSQIFAFLRYQNEDIYLIVIRFDQQTDPISIRIGNHAFASMGLEPDRLSCQGLHPSVEPFSLLVSQASDQGIPVSFNSSGWSVVKIKA